MHRVWTYWEYKNRRGARPAYLDLCTESVRGHLGPLTLELVDQDSIFEWLPDLDADTWRRLPGPSWRSDYGRARLGARYGGIYLDVDCVVVDDLGRLLEPLGRCDFASWGREAGGRMYDGLFAARPGARLLEEWAEAQDRALHEVADWTRLPWSFLGQDLLGPVASRVEYHNYPLATIAPVMWYEWRRFLSKVASPARLFAHRPHTVMLWNGFMARPLREITSDELLRGNALLSRVLRIGLGRTTPDQELDGWTRLHHLADLRFSRFGRALGLGRPTRRS